MKDKSKNFPNKVKETQPDKPVKKIYTKPRINKLGKLKNITLGASLVGIDSQGRKAAV